VPSGGTTGQFLAKNSNTSYDDYWVDPPSSSAAAWGAITGTLNNQTDLATALANKIAANSTIIGATKTKITYDTKGLVTAGADATTADIVDSTNKRYVTDAQLTTISNTSGSNTGDQDLSGLVPKTTTVNGHALSTNVTVTKGDVSLGNVDNTSDATKNSAVTTLTNKDLTSGTNTFPTFNQNTTGSAAKLTTGRTIAVTGDVTYTSPSFDGSANVTAAGTLATVNSNTGSFGSATQVATFTVNGKGLTTAASNTTIAIPESAVTNLTSDLALLAPLASPTFTGTVTLPTTGSGSTEAARRDFVERIGYFMPATTGGDAIVTPVNAAFSTATTGGSLVAATYWYRVAAINSRGRTIASTETSQVVPAGTSTNTVTVNWGAVTGATGYGVYGRTTGAEQLIADVGAVTTYVDTGSITPSGALPTANTTSGDDTALFTAAEAALPTGGGTIWLSKGTYSLPTGYSFTKPVNLVGHGMGDPYAYQPSAFPSPLSVRGITTILCGSTTANCIGIAGQGTTMRDFSIVNTTPTPTAGSGINVTGGNLTRIMNVGRVGFYDNLVYSDGELPILYGGHSMEAVRYHVRYSNVTVVDGGDALIQGESYYQVTRTATAAIFWQSGGGLKVNNCKINCVVNKISSGISLDPLGTTTVFIISNNSIENCLVGVNFNRTSGSSNIGQIQILGNEFGNHQYAVLVQSAGFSLGEVAGNIIKSCTISGISLASTNTWHIAPNHHNTYTSTAVPVQLASTCTAIKVDEQYVDTGFVYGNSATVSTPGVAFWSKHYQGLPTINTTDVTLWRLGVAIVTAGYIDFELGGQLIGDAQFAHIGTRSFTRGSSGAVTIATVGTDSTIGTTADWTLTFDTAAVTGEIQIKLKRTTATAIKGTMEIDVHGALASVKIGA
jgi:hypothetical protein